MEGLENSSVQFSSGRGRSQDGVFATFIDKDLQIWALTSLLGTVGREGRHSPREYSLVVEGIMIPNKIAKPLAFGVGVAPMRLEGESRFRNFNMLRLCSAHEIPQLFQVIRARHWKSDNVRLTLCGGALG